MTSMLFVTSNGAGMGHLSRQLSIARSTPDDTRSTLFSLSMGLPQVLGLGVHGEYCPSYDRGWMPRWFWNRYLRTRLVALIREVSADVVVFDGVAPYRGLLAARPYVPDTAFVWLRRGMWLEGTGESFLASSSQFDLVLEPGDLARESDSGPTAHRTDAVLIPPISMLEVIDRLPRTEAAAALGLDPSRRTVLLTLGSGRLGDVEGPGRIALDALLEHTDWQVAVTTAAIATSDIPIPDPDRVVAVKGVYPLVRHLHAFDAAVSAAGYNAVHEFVSGGIPTLLVPNRSTRTDDQGARAIGVAERNLALVAEGDDRSGLQAGVHDLLDDDRLRELRLRIDGLPPHERMGGAARAAELSIGVAERHTATAGMRARGLWRVVDDAARTTAMSVLGGRGTELVRRAVRRPELGGIGSPLSVTITDTRPESVGPDDEVLPLLFSDTVTVEDTRSRAPVEHVLPGASDDYLKARRAIIERNYRVVDT